jgi:hypothetical protein
MNDRIGSLINNLTDIAFNKADELWRSVQDGLEDFINNNQGSTAGKGETIARPDWDAVKDFLRGNISLFQLKSLMNCP